MPYRAGDLRDIYDDNVLQKSPEERKVAMERLKAIRTANGPMLRSELVAEVRAALLAAGSLREYTFNSAADVPSSSNAPGSSGLSDLRAPALRIRFLIGARDTFQLAC